MAAGGGGMSFAQQRFLCNENTPPKFVAALFYFRLLSMYFVSCLFISFVYKKNERVLI